MYDDQEFINGKLITKHQFKEKFKIAYKKIEQRCLSPTWTTATAIEETLSELGVKNANYDFLPSVKVKILEKWATD